MKAVRDYSVEVIWPRGNTDGQWILHRMPYTYPEAAAEKVRAESAGWTARIWSSKLTRAKAARP